MSNEIQAQVVVLGAGPGGYSAAFRAADLGLDVVLVESRATLGGVCLNVGCIPSKALLHVAKVIDDAAAMASHGVTFGKPEIDLDKIRGWKENVIGQLTGGLGGMSKARKVKTVTGFGKFTSDKTIEVEGADGNTTITFDNAELSLLTGDNDAAASFFTIQNSDGDHTGGNLYLLDLDYSADDGDVDADFLKCQDSGGTVLTIQQNGDIVTEGKLQAGTTLFVSGISTLNDQMIMGSDTDTAATSGFIDFRRERDGDPTQDVSSGDELGELRFRGYHTDGYYEAAIIRGFADAAGGSGDMPGRLEFFTSADGSATPALALSIDDSQNFNFQNGDLTIGGLLTGVNAVFVPGATDNIHIEGDTNKSTGVISLIDIDMTGDTDDDDKQIAVDIDILRDPTTDTGWNIGVDVFITSCNMEDGREAVGFKSDGDVSACTGAAS